MVFLLVSGTKKFALCQDECLHYLCLLLRSMRQFKLSAHQRELEEIRNSGHFWLIEEKTTTREHLRPQLVKEHRERGKSLMTKPVNGFEHSVLEPS
jgi:hypothetical protein